MNQKQTTNKDKRCELRLPEELKEQVNTYCKENNCTISEFAREAFIEKLTQTSHTQTEVLLIANKVHNLTLAYRTRLPKDYRTQLTEVLKYE